jgi:hypothetical protein
MTGVAFIKELIGMAANKAVLFAASKGVPSGLKTALQHVPTWTHAHQVLESHLALYGGGGAAGGIASGMAAKKLALKRASAK